jgi:hypothetical protein
LRLSSAAPWPERIAQARSFFDRFEPDFISLQFVCYGFHPRGFDFRLPRRFAAVCDGWRVQMMFHELWVGAETGASAKHRLIGSLQRRMVLETVRRIRPILVHTSNGGYIHLLKQNGVHAERLSIPGCVRPSPDDTQGMRIDGEWCFGMFGTLHPVWPPEPLFAHLKKVPGLKEILHIGGIGTGEDLWKEMTGRYAGDFTFRRTGVLNEDGLRAAFDEIDIGIATTPWDIIGKSASVATMLDLGLPVIVNRDDVHYPGWREPGWTPQLIRMDENLPDKLMAARRQPADWSAPRVAARFLEHLETNLSA